jgi:hypothetical protein
MCLYVLYRVSCCDVRYDFCMKTMLGSSSPPVVCRRAHALVFISCAWLRIVVYSTFLCMLAVSLDCPFLIAPSVFSNVYFMGYTYLGQWPLFNERSLVQYLCCGFLCLVYPMLAVSLDCPFLIASSVFSNVYFMGYTYLGQSRLTILIELRLLY